MEWLSTHFGWPALITLLGALVTTGGAMWAALDQNRKDQELKGKAEEIASLNRRIADLVTGETNLSLSFQLGERQTALDAVKWFVLIIVANEGDRVAYDVVINAVNVLEVESLKSRVPESLAARLALESMFQKTVGTVASKQAVALTRQLFELPQEDKQAVYEFTIWTRGGKVSQVVRFLRTDEGWTFATKAIRNDGVLVYKHVEPGYPDVNLDHDEWWKAEVPNSGPDGAT